MGVSRVLTLLGFQGERPARLYLMAIQPWRTSRYRGRRSAGWGQVLPLFFLIAGFVGKPCTKWPEHEEFYRQKEDGKQCWTSAAGRLCVPYNSDTMMRRKKILPALQNLIPTTKKSLRFVTDAREKGQHDTLHAVSRRQYDDHGSLVDTHGPTIRSLYGSLLQSRKVSLIDVHQYMPKAQEARAR